MYVKKIMYRSICAITLFGHITCPVIAGVNDEEACFSSIKKAPSLISLGTKIATKKIYNGLSVLYKSLSGSSQDEFAELKKSASQKEIFDEMRRLKKELPTLATSKKRRCLDLLDQYAVRQHTYLRARFAELGGAGYNPAGIVAAFLGLPWEEIVFDGVTTNLDQEIFRLNRLQQTGYDFQGDKQYIIEKQERNGWPVLEAHNVQTEEKTHVSSILIGSKRCWWTSDKGTNTAFVTGDGHKLICCYLPAYEDDFEVGCGLSEPASIFMRITDLTSEKTEKIRTLNMVQTNRRYRVSDTHFATLPWEFAFRLGASILHISYPSDLQKHTIILTRYTHDTDVPDIFRFKLDDYKLTTGDKNRLGSTLENPDHSRFALSNLEVPINGQGKNVYALFKRHMAVPPKGISYQLIEFLSDFAKAHQYALQHNKSVRLTAEQTEILRAGRTQFGTYPFLPASLRSRLVPFAPPPTLVPRSSEISHVTE